MSEDESLRSKFLEYLRDSIASPQGIKGSIRFAMTGQVDRKHLQSTVGQPEGERVQ